MKRLRYSMPDEQWALVEETAKVLAVDPKLVMQLAMSIGIRFLDFSVVHPVSIGIQKAVDERAAQGAATILGDFGKAIGQAASIEPTIATNNVATKKTIPRRKASRRGK